MPLPESFCWTRFGTEAGQQIGEILARKEVERVANNGTFLWGIGNAIGPSMLELIRRSVLPEVLFSPMRSGPRQQDAEPSSVVYWTAAQTLFGERYVLPRCTMVTSRGAHGEGPSRHYALVCHKKSPLAFEAVSEKLQFTGLRNLLTDRPVGASQVTAVVSLGKSAKTSSATFYDIAFRAQLIPPYFVVLREPVALAPSDTACDWNSIIRKTLQSRTTPNFHSRCPE